MGANYHKSGDGIVLTNATVQELQLELLRRTSFNSLNGDRVVRDLLQHRDLWLAAILDRLPVWTIDAPVLPLSWLIKLRDLSSNFWNADTLILLTDSQDKLQKLKSIADGDPGWGGDVESFDEADREEIDRSLGAGRQPYFIMTVWWD